MEIFSLFLSKLIEWLILNLFANLFYNLAMDMKSYGCALFLLLKPPNPSLKPPTQPPQNLIYPTLTKTHVENFTLGASKKTIACDINGSLLRSSSFFPFFMLVAFEGGSIFRAFFLLLSYPLTCIFDPLKVMVFITFCGMKVEAMQSVERTVLPKFYLEELNPLVYEMWASAEGKFVITSLPKVMVDWFAKEYLGATHVLATHLHSFHGFFTGLLGTSNGFKDCVDDTEIDVGIVGIQSCVHHQFFINLCKVVYVVSRDTPIPNLHRNRYPKPLVFHDGRLAFLPTPLSTLSMFLYLPLAVPLALLRLLIAALLPLPLTTLLGSFLGIRLIFSPNLKDQANTEITVLARSSSCSLLHKSSSQHRRQNRNVLYVSNHRTLLDPVFLSFALQKPLTAVTYSLSRFSELIAPIPTVRLTRNRALDARTMQTLLAKGDLVVCPEGTTCREPYLLRFSSLFAELTDDIVPVAVEAHVSMFYGTTASGFKWLDPIFFLMNPSPGYSVRVLDKVGPEMTCGGGRSSFEVANYVQRVLGAALGFECTGFTRKDKYLMLAGHDGFVGTTN